MKCCAACLFKSTVFYINLMFFLKLTSREVTVVQSKKDNSFQSEVSSTLRGHLKKAGISQS